MPYNISSVKFHKLESGQKYFLDANIWIFILAPPNKPTFKTKLYSEFFDAILNNNEVKIVVPSLLISEVINRILKNVYFQAYLRKNNVNPAKVNQEYYKTIFRPSQFYKDSYETLTNDFIAYKDSVQFVNDGLGEDITENDILENPSTNLDFNDNYYYNLALKRGYIVVTDDGDFWVEELRVLTHNDALIQKQTSENMRIAKEKK